MYVLFEEDGAFKAGTILADNDASIQVELPTGKRSKVKAASVLLRFREPAPAQLLENAEAQAEGMEAEFLWECAGEAEFAFADFAREYYGHEPSAVEAAAVLLRLHAAPVYFHRKGRGRYRPAPPDILKAALAGLEKKRQQALAVERMQAELEAGTLPAEFPPLLDQLLYKPDRNKLETKALEAACAATGLDAAHLLARAGAIPSSHDYHFRRFLLEYFPHGMDFPGLAAAPEPDGLPLAPVAAFSIDDAHTTEIDDAFSVTPLADAGWRIGIHIAAPGLGVAPGSEIDAVARERLSTVYMPGNKITMLPPQAVERFTLSAGRECPALSLYLDVAPDLSVRGHESRIERVAIAANLRHHDIEPVFNEDTVEAIAAGGGPDLPFKTELALLWRLANRFEAGRGKPAAKQTQKDYNFVVLREDVNGTEHERIVIDERRRGSPLDKLVSELMIVANSTWGALLAEHGVPGLYRAQSNGRVRMTTAPAPHQGLGVAQYAWSTSPLRRYADLVNQWQLIACLRGEAAPFAPRSEALFSILRDFDQTYSAYADFQRGMERYWCLRWLEQEGVRETAATVWRESLVKIDRLPLFQRVPSLPTLPPGTRVRLAVDSIDYLAVDAHFRHVETLAEAAEEVTEDMLDESAEEGIAAAEPAPPAEPATTAGAEAAPPAAQAG